MVKRCQQKNRRADYRTDESDTVTNSIRQFLAS